MCAHSGPLMDDDELLRLVAARCPELSELALDRIASALGQTITTLDGEQAERLIDALDALETRLARMVADATAYREAAEAAAVFIDSASEVFH